MYFVVTEGHATLLDIIVGAEQKFGTDFNSRLFLEQLVYLSDLDDTEIHFIKSHITPEDIQRFFEKRIREVSDKL